MFYYFLYIIIALYYYITVCINVSFFMNLDFKF